MRLERREGEQASTPMLREKGKGKREKGKRKKGTINKRERDGGEEEK
jgi:hypothetical protein